MSLGTAATAWAIGGLVAGKTVADIHGNRSASAQNRRATEATERSDIRAGEREQAALEESRRQHEATLARQQAEDTRVEQQRMRDEQARQERLAFAREQWSGYLGAQQPHWRLGANVLGRLSDMAGGDLSAGGGDMSQYLASLPTSGGGSGVAGGVSGLGPGSAPAQLRPRADLSGTITRPDRGGGVVFPQASRSAPSLNDLMVLLAQGDGQTPTPPRPLPTRGPRGGLSMADYYRLSQALPAL